MKNPDLDLILVKTRKNFLAQQINLVDTCRQQEAIQFGKLVKGKDSNGIVITCGYK